MPDTALNCTLCLPLWAELLQSKLLKVPRPVTQDHMLMGALTRVLSEEYKKSVELCYNTLRAFLVSDELLLIGEKPGFAAHQMSER